MKIGEFVDFTIPPHPKGVRLCGTYVCVVPLCAAQHGEDLFEAFQNAPDSDWTYLFSDPIRDKNAYLASLKTLETQQDPACMVIVHTKTKKAVGVASFMRIDRPNGGIEVGNIQYAPTLKRTTGATEAMLLMMQWAFDNGYRRYEWKCNRYNIPSRKSAQRLGFAFEGIFRQAMIVKGHNRDTAWFSIIDKEWHPLKQAYDTFLADDNFNADGTAKIALSHLTKPLLHKIDMLEDI